MGIDYRIQEALNRVYVREKNILRQIDIEIASLKRYIRILSYLPNSQFLVNMLSSEKQIWIYKGKLYLKELLEVKKETLAIGEGRTLKCF